MSLRKAPGGADTPGKIITFAGGKGGPGKSTALLSLAVEYHRRGLRVLIVDADDEQRTAATWADVASENEHDAPTVITLGDNVREALPELARGYQLTLVDTPGRNGRRATFALRHSDLAVLPCGPHGPEIWRMAATLDQVRDVQEVRPELVAAILVTKVQVNTVIGRDARAALEDTGAEVFGTVWHYRLAFGESITGGQGPTTYEPRGEAAAETVAFADEIARRIGLPTPATKRKGKLRAV